MKKSQLFIALLNIVCNETEVDKDILLSRNRSAEGVDARHIFIKCLYDNGLYPNEIASRLGVSTRAVTHALSSFHDRCSFGFYLRNNYEKIKKQLLDKEITSADL